MTGNFTIKDDKIIINNRGAMYGSIFSYFYDIGNRLYEFAIMESKDFEKIDTLYDEIINIVCTLKECDDEKTHEKYLDKLFDIVDESIRLCPYTYFYTQTLIDIIVKTYNSEEFRSDLLFKYKFRVLIKDRKYYPNKNYVEMPESPPIFEMIIYSLHSNGPLSENEHLEYYEFFITIKNLLMEEFKTKKSDLKKRLELISEYSNNPLVKNLSIEERLYLYEAKRIFNLNYFTTSPIAGIFLDTSFKIKYNPRAISKNYRSLELEDLISEIKDKRLTVEKVYELDNIDDQIKFELLKIIEKNYVINKCENCGKLFIPITSSKNKEQKGRTDQKYCDNIYLDTGKTCKEIGAMNKRKEKVENSPILSEYQREYKRMHGLHYNHQKQFTEKKFKDWSKKANKLKEKFTDEQVNDFKIELKKLSNKYWNTNN